MLELLKIQWFWRKSQNQLKPDFTAFPAKISFCPQKPTLLSSPMTVMTSASCPLHNQSTTNAHSRIFRRRPTVHSRTWSESLNRWGARLQNFSGNWKITEMKNRNRSELFSNPCPYKQIQFPISVKMRPVPRIFKIWQLPTTLYCPPSPPICTKKWLGFQSTTPTRISCIHSIVYYNTISRSTTPVRIRSTPKRKDLLWSESGAMTEKIRSTC